MNATDTVSTSVPSASVANRPTALSVVGGLLLTLPALFACLLGLVIPTLATLNLSLTRATPTSREAPFVGGENYAALLSDPTFLNALAFSAALVAVVLLAVGIIPPLVSAALLRSGPVARRIARALLSLPLAFYAPVPWTMVWVLLFNPLFGWTRGPRSWLGDRQMAPVALALVIGTAALALALGAASLIPAPREDASRRHTQGAWTFYAVGLLAALGITLQIFTPIYLLTRGEPANATPTLSFEQYVQGFQLFRFGPAAAISFLQIALLAGLGLMAVALLVFSNVAFDWSARRTVAGRPAANLAALGAGLVVTLALALPLAWTWLVSVSSAANLAQGSVGLAGFDAYSRSTLALPWVTAMVNTYVPPLVAVVPQVLCAYLAALGIGALRPLGRWSEVLLFLFAPWVLLGSGPFTLQAFMNAGRLGTLNTDLALVPPLSVSVPLLILLTLFFKGQAARRREHPGPFLSSVLLPSLPLTFLLGALAYLIQVQDLQWPLVMASRRELWTVPVALASLLGQAQIAWPTWAAALLTFELPLAFAMFLILAVLQVWYMDRLGIVRLGGQ